MDLDRQKMINLNKVQDYKAIMSEAVSGSFPLLSKQEIDEAVQYSILKRYKKTNAKLHNNYEETTTNGTIVDIVRYIEWLHPIVTSYGVLFKRHKVADNPLSRMIQGFLKDRGIHKKQMFQYPKGHELFARYNLLQLLDKLNANAVYGCLGAPTSMYYNIYICEAVTRQGQAYTSNSIMLFESLLANNVKFNSVNEIIMFIHNVIHEHDKRKFLDEEIIPIPITLDECFFKIMNTVDMMYWVPTQKEMILIWERLSILSQEELNRLYYKNNIYSFCDLPKVTQLIVKILDKLEEPFMDPNKPPKIIVRELDMLVDLIKEFVYYGYPYIDKIDRINYMQRDIVCISDTDSTIISFDAWYRFVLSKVYDIDLKIKKEKVNIAELIKADEFGDKPKRKIAELVKPHFDYNFYTDEVIEETAKRNIGYIVPQDSLKYSIINMMGYVCSQLLTDYFEVYTRLTGSWDDSKPCHIIMKNEFYFLRALITENIRNYANIQALQEGHIVPEDKRLAVMGLAINKSVLPDLTKERLQEILYNDILAAPKVDQIKIMKKLNVIEKDIYNHIMAKGLDYYRPDNIKAISMYSKDPMSVNGVKAAMFYNMLKDEDMPAINLEESNSIIKIALNVTKKNVDKIKDKYPEVYAKIVDILNDPGLPNLDIIGLPIDVDIPDWVLEFVDYVGIINDNLKPFPIDTIGLKRLGNDNVNVSNIISL